MHTVTDERTTAQDRRPLLPDPLRDEDQYRRFHHYDLVDLPPERVWAEKVLLTEELARRVYDNRPRMIWIHGDQRVSDVQWLRDRLAKLKTIRAAA